MTSGPPVLLNRRIGAQCRARGGSRALLSWPFAVGVMLGLLLAPLLAAAQSATVPQAAQVQEPPLRIVDDAERRELVIELGPLDLPANADHHDVAQPATRAVTIPIDGWIHGFRIEVVDRAGRAVPQQILHHINVIAAGRRELFSQIMLRVAAAGQETGPAILPRLFGFEVHKGEELLVSSMLHNPTPQAYNGAVIRVRMPYTSAGAWLSPMRAYPFYLDVMPPAGETHAYDLPPGRSEKSWEGRPAIAGRILGVGGHLHQYGVALRLEDVTAGKVLWEANPVLDEEGNLIGMPIKKFIWRLGIPIRPDHTYRLTAIYDNPTGETIPDGAMGALGGVFLPARGTAWPVIDPRSPEYQLDLRVTRGSGGGHGEGGHHH